MIVAKASPTRRFVLQCLAGAIGFAAFGDNAQAQRKAHPNPLIRKFVGHTDLISSVAFSPDGRTALTGSFDNTLKLWDVATGATIHTFAGHSDFVTSVAFLSDGRTALSGSKDATVRMWEVATGKEPRTLKGPAGPIYRIAISSDGHTILAGAETGLTLWDRATGRELRTIAGAGPVAALSPDGRTVLAGAGGLADGSRPLKSWDAATGKELLTFTGHTGPVYAIAFLADGRTALSAGYNQYRSKGDAGMGALRYWEVATGKEVRRIDMRDEGVGALAVSLENGIILSGDTDLLLRLREASTGNLLFTFGEPLEQITSVALSADGRMALSGSMDGTALLWALPQR